LTQRLSLLALFDRLADRRTVAYLEHAVIQLSVVGLIAHLGLVAASQAEILPATLSRHIGMSFLSALYTPFSFILFFEVFLLVLALPASTTVSLGKQYEIVSLIILRSVFKDVAEFDGLSSLGSQQDAFFDVLVDMGGGVAMFLLVALFYHVSQRRPAATVLRRRTADVSPRLQRFINHKKLLALALTGVLTVLALWSFIGWGIETWGVVVHGHAPFLDVDQVFYVDFFTTMIFVDVLVLLLSMRQNTDYRFVFRNAGFVVSTILLRFSLTLKKPYDVELALLAVAFGVAVGAIFRYWTWLSRTPAEP